MSAGEPWPKCWCIDGGFGASGSTLTLHRTKKYDAAKGLADYDSTHDYKMGELGFTRIFPNPVASTV